MLVPSPATDCGRRTSRLGAFVRATLLLAIGVLAIACDEAVPTPADTDAGIDTGTSTDVDVGDDALVEYDADDADDDADGSGDDDATADTDADAGPVEPAEPPQFDAPPAADAAEWTDLSDRVTWLIGVTDSNRTDGTYSDLEAGTFTFPSLGGGPYGVRWSEAEFAEDGSVSNGANTTLYMVARVSLEEGERGVILQSDRSYRAWLDGRRRPGDIYGGNGIRVGWPAEPGEHVVVVQFEGRRGAPRIAAWTTPDPVVFNTADMTTPQLVAGTEDDQWVGIPVVVLSDTPLAPVRTRVVGSDVVEEATFLTPGLGPGSTTQMPFPLRPTDRWPEEGPVSVTLRIEAPQLEESLETTIEIEVVPEQTTYRRTRLSATDHSVQYAGIVPPTGDEPDDGWGMVLSLHGAAVQGLGQARSYAPKDWAVIVAPTNRRPFGFDWEVFGRLDALEALEDAKEHFGFDPTRVHVTGHSMGGHGTWQLGTLFPTLFATVGPSAGWDSFYSYGGESAPTGVFARGQASSFTSNYAPTNLSDRAVYVIHGDADDNVPVREARNWVELLTPVVPDLQYHEQPGAGHWWNVDPEPGADCVDWPALWETMEDRRLDPFELDFTFLSPAPWVSPRHSFVTVDAVATPMQDFRLEAAHEGDSVTLTTDNVLRLVLDGDALGEAGISEVVVDGEAVAVVPGPITVGASSAKRLGLAGPFNTALHAPFCIVYEAAGPPVYAELAAWWAAEWSAIGNGHACTVTWEELTPWVEENYQLVFMGVPPQWIEFDGPVEFSLAGDTVSAGDFAWAGVALATAYPYAGRQAALLVASDGRESLLFRYSPFQSRFVLPDLLVWGDGGASAVGYYDTEWALDPALANGL